jgi:hypothetical protein
MTPALVLTNETDSMACSIYQKESGEYTLWVKVGSALIEVREHEFDDFVEIILESLKDLEDITGVERNVE